MREGTRRVNFLNFFLQKNKIMSFSFCVKLKFFKKRPLTKCTTCFFLQGEGNMPENVFWGMKKFLPWEKKWAHFFFCKFAMPWRIGHFFSFLFQFFSNSTRSARGRKMKLLHNCEAWSFQNYFSWGPFQYDVTMVRWVVWKYSFPDDNDNK